MEEYIKKHGPGNFQTLLESYRPGGIRSDAQIEGDVFMLFKRRANGIGELAFKEITMFLKENGFSDGRKRLEMANRIASRLMEARVKIWR